MVINSSLPFSRRLVTVSVRLLLTSNKNNNCCRPSNKQHHNVDVSIHVVRSFFASSTDHTRLLKESQVHKLTIPNPDKKPNGTSTISMYVMAASGMDFGMVQKVPQLHLARIYFDDQNKTMYGAKVINRALGNPVNVCGKLVDAILNEQQRNQLKARSTLHGLSDFVLQGLQKKDTAVQKILQGHSPSILSAVESIARGKTDKDPNTYNTGKKIWEQLAIEFIQRSQTQSSGQEIALYMSKGGNFLQILHQVDQSEYADTAGQAMALFEFQ